MSEIGDYGPKPEDEISLTDKRQGKLASLDGAPPVLGPPIKYPTSIDKACHEAWGK